MNSQITVHVPTVSLDDARHDQSTLFKPAICALLNDGYVVKIETRTDAKSFNNMADFLAWFDGRNAVKDERPVSLPSAAP